MRGSAQALNKGGKVIHARRVRLYAHLVKPLIALSRALSDIRQSGHSCQVDKLIEPAAEATLAANLTALQAYYRAKNKTRDVNGKPRPASDKALAEATGVSRKTLQAGREGSRPLGVDNIQKIARAYGLHVYQMLIPGLEPDNPATVPVTVEEKEMLIGVKEAMKRIKIREDDLGKASGSRGVAVGGHTPRTGRRKAVHALDKK